MLSKLASLGRPVLLPIGRHLERRGRSMDPCAADCIVVPGSWVSKEGVPSGSLERRVHTALDHLALSLSGFVIFTGGAVGGRAVEAEVAARIARDRGLADDRSLVERSSRNTFENLRNARAIMRDHGLRTALVCSDAVHLP
ncbi:MAG: YdcF family protein, partial [Polyangiaceae bacterium]